MLRIKGYDLFASISLFVSLFLTQILYPRARIVRFPCSIRIFGHFEYGSRWTVGTNCRVDVFNDGRLCIGDNVEINDRVHIACASSISIGDSTLIASGVFITDHDHVIPLLGEPYTRLDVVGMPVTIGNRVWIGQNVCVLKGVSIASDCVVGAGSVVSKSLTLPGIYVGVPAKLIRVRS